MARMISIEMEVEILSLYEECQDCVAIAKTVRVSLSTVRNVIRRGRVRTPQEREAINSGIVSYCYTPTPDEIQARAAIVRIKALEAMIESKSPEEIRAEIKATDPEWLFIKENCAYP